MSAHRYISEATQNQVRQHFIWSGNGLRIIGLTPTGRATVAALVFNRERIINIRAADIEIGRHPPSGDPIQK